jgi:hypothetical protein
MRMRKSVTVQNMIERRFFRLARYGAIISSLWLLLRDFQESAR